MPFVTPEARPTGGPQTAKNPNPTDILVNRKSLETVRDRRPATHFGTAFKKNLLGQPGIS